MVAGIFNTSANCKTRRAYIEFCKDQIKRFLQACEGRLIRQYYKDGKDCRIGVVCAFMLHGTMYIGASKCNSAKHDKFDRHMGVWQAINRACVVNDDWPNSYAKLHEEHAQMSADTRRTFDTRFPWSMHNLVCTMISRGRQHFFPKEKSESTKAEAATV